MPKQAFGQSAAILDSFLIALVVLKGGRIAWGNNAAHQIYGYPRDELIGKALRDLFPDSESHDAFDREASAAIGKGRTYRAEIGQRRRDGSVGWFEISIARSPDQPDALAGLIVDVTEKHKHAEALKASEEHYRSVVQDQTEVISRVLPDGTFMFVNDVFCRLFGKSCDELVGQKWHPVAHPDDIPMIEARLREMTPDHPVVTIENRVFVAGGAVRWMQFANRGLFNRDGTLRELQSVGRDITDLKQIETQLRESDERLEMALLGSGLVLWDWNIPERKVVAGNRWFELLGYTPEGLGSDEDDWLALINPLDFEAFKQKISTHLSGETAGFESEHRLRHRNGHWVMVEAKGKVTQWSEDGKPLRMVGTLQDITQKKRLSNEGVDLLKRIESMIRAATSGVSQTPVRPKVIDTLTSRQRQTIAMIAKGMTSAQIANELAISTGTAIGHRRNLMKKLDLHSAAEVTRFALSHGLVDG